jgi:tripartite-type tricarboxylate transporter receptor subunit TctC
MHLVEICSMRASRFLNKKRFAQFVALTAIAATLAGAPRMAAAEEWPTRPVTLVMAFASSAMQRVDFLPDVPTMKEAGFDVVGTLWFGIFGPAHMPAEAVAKLNLAIDAFLHKPETRSRLSEAGFRVLGGPPAQVSERVSQDRATWSQTIERLNIVGDK